MEIEEKKFNEKIQKKVKEVYTWGLGAEGQLGTGNAENVKTPFRVKIDDAVEIAAGGQYSAIVTHSGELYFMGSNKRFKFGRVDETNFLLPTLIKLPFKVKLVACGDWHTIITDEAGNCYGTGCNKSGCLGLGTNIDQKEFSKIPFQTEVIQISCGRNISLFLTNDKQLFSAGKSSLHGNPQTSDQFAITLIKSLQEIKIQNFSAGFSCCACVSIDGKLYTWGHGADFQLGHGTNNDIKEPKIILQFEKNKVFIVQVSCSRSDKHCHMGCVDNEGNCYSWGSAYKGKLGFGKTWTHGQKLKEQITPKKIDYLNKIPIRLYLTGGIHSAVLTQEGALMTFGCGSDGRLGHKEIKNHKYLYKEPYPKEIEDFQNYFVLQAATSYYHMIALVYKK